MKSINIKFPLEDDIVKNTFFSTNNISKKALSSNLILLLLTEKGERYYMPDYGTNLLKFIFEPNDDDTTVNVKEDLNNTVSKYMPQITISNVEFNRLVDENNNPISENNLSVKINFTYREESFNENGEIELNF